MLLNVLQCIGLLPPQQRIIQLQMSIRSSVEKPWSIPVGPLSVLLNCHDACHGNNLDFTLFSLPPPPWLRLLQGSLWPAYHRFSPEQAIHCPFSSLLPPRSHTKGTQTNKDSHLTHLWIFDFDTSPSMETFYLSYRVISPFWQWEERYNFRMKWFFSSDCL